VIYLHNKGTKPLSLTHNAGACAPYNTAVAILSACRMFYCIHTRTYVAVFSAFYQYQHSAWRSFSVLSASSFSSSSYSCIARARATTPAVAIAVDAPDPAGGGGAATDATSGQSPSPAAQACVAPASAVQAVPAPD
jgi:hypothetical protein